MELVKCNNLCKKFDDKQILNNINITIPKGKIVLTSSADELRKKRKCFNR